ncbi:MAG: hypothetical protein ACKVP3_24075 [Hyphomicrobiaceae bacterium]
MRVLEKVVRAGDAGDELDRIAKRRAQELGVSEAEAYVLSMVERPDLAEAAVEGYAADADGAERIVKRAESLEDSLERMAHDRAARTGETFAKAYVQIIESDYGRAAYAQICDLRDGAARRSSGLG